jgi:hypothetical protein
VVDLGGQIVPPQRDVEQKPHPGHDPVAIADAQPALDQMQLEAADDVGARRVGRPAEKCGEPLAAVDVASVRVRLSLRAAMSSIMRWRSQLEVVSVLMELLLSEVAKTSILRTAPHPVIANLSTGYCALAQGTPRSGWSAAT